MNAVNPLLAGLGLDKAESNPNALPDATYDGKVYSDSLVYVPSKDELSHVFNYEPDGMPGKRKDEWFLILKEPRTADGTPPEKGAVSIEQIATGTPAMSEGQASFYKRRLMSLGHSEEEVDNATIAFGEHKDLPITFTVKTNGKGYQNVTYVAVRSPETETTEAVSLSFD